MATLTSNITETTNPIAVSGDVSAADPGTDYRIDDEVITLRGFARVPAVRGPRQRNIWEVSRGQADTIPTSHLAGAEIVAVTEAVATGLTLTQPEPFVLTTGGEQTVRLLGPFPVAFDTPGTGTSEDGAVLTLLDAGTVLVKIGVIVQADFGGVAVLDISIGGADYAPPDDDFLRVFRLPANASTIVGNGYTVGGPQDPTDAGSEFALLTTNGALIAQFANATPVVGSADIYALIAQPSE